MIVFFILILSTGVFVSEPQADDLNTPAKCRPKEAIDDPNCAPIIERRFVDRNLRLNKQDKLANADIKRRNWRPLHILEKRFRLFWTTLVRPLRSS